MKKILAIGGAVIKTARSQLYKVIESGEVEMLIHNGGSLFHDFQLSLDPPPDNKHSHSIDDLLTDYSVNDKTSECVNRFIVDCAYFIEQDKLLIPEGSVTHLCHEMDIPVLMFTAFGCDFWNMNTDMKRWEEYARVQWMSMNILLNRFHNDRFHYICMGSAVIHPEIFIKCIAMSSPKYFTADVVDFIDMYRPRTRVACYGSYHRTSHEIFLKRWIERIINEK